MGPIAGARASVNVTTINLASSNGKKTQSADDIMRQIESTFDSSTVIKQGELNNRIQSRINEHEAAFGDRSLPRQRLPKVDNILLDRYQAARQNMLVLGAIQQVADSKPKRSARSVGSKAASKGSAAPTAAATTAAATADGSLNSAASSVDLETDATLLLTGAAAELDSAFTSFHSSSKGAEDLMSPEASALDAEPSYVSSQRTGRRLNRRISNGSVVSRASHISHISSFASGFTSSTGQQHSCINSSNGGGSGMCRSQRVNSVAGSSWSGGHHSSKKSHKRKPPKRKPGRVTLAFAEFGSKDDWVSKTLLKHALASIIQARWRGYSVRQRWKQDKERLVEEEKARLAAAETQQERLQEMQRKLLLYQQKKLAKAAAEAVAAADGAAAAADGTAAAAAGAGSGGHAGGQQQLQLQHTYSRRTTRASAPGGGGSTSRHETPRHVMSGDCQQDSDSDSGWSDVELEDVAAIKFRAATPPWQKVAETRHMSLQLRQRTAAAAAAALGEPADSAVGWDGQMGGMLCFWDSSSGENNAKLQELRHRRICRKPQPVPLSAAAVAAAAASGLLGNGLGGTEGSGGIEGAAAASQPLADDDDLAGGAAGAPIPTWVVEELLLERYSSKYSRLGVPHKMPGRERWAKLLQARTAAAAAAGLDDVEEATADVDVFAVSALDAAGAAAAATPAATE